VALGYTEFSMTFDVVVRNATRSTFLTSEAALYAAFKQPDQKLEVFLGASTRHTFDPAANTGFNSRATIERPPSELNTANSGLYRVSVLVQLPADLSGRDGRQTSTVTVEAGLVEYNAVTVGLCSALPEGTAVAVW
jgi:hypothetical protein